MKTSCKRDYVVKLACQAVSALVVLASALAAETVRAAHPPIRLVDREGKNVLDSGRPASTSRSCNHCHDTRYIATHSYHASLGWDERVAAGTMPGGRPWDWSPGGLGRWNPLVYSLVPARGDRNIDLSLSDWIATFPRHVGGGPAESNHVQSAGVEMNCFLCHSGRPDNQARLKELREGRFAWANTATLAAAGVVRETVDGWLYQRSAFLADGRLDARTLGICEPTSQHCGQCHGLTHRGEEPLRLDLSLRQWATATAGQVFSSQRISQSAVNLKGKEQLSRSWDVHAERMLECRSCHFSLNNPAFYEPSPRSRPKHLVFEPRRLPPGQYIERPSHQLAKGNTAPGGLARHLDGTMRRCGDCHNSADIHDWLPYRETHLARLSCEACHIAVVQAPAIRQIDWTLLSVAGEPRVEWRGIEGATDDPTAEISGFRPVLLPTQGLDGRRQLTPHNLISAWYWIEGGSAPRPIPLADLRAALLEGGAYHPDIRRALGDGPAVLDTPAKIDAVRRRLEAIGARQPRIEAEMQSYGVHHGVAPARDATRHCETCHTDNSRLTESFELASYLPGDVVPKPVADGTTELAGRLQMVNGRLTYTPGTGVASLYVLGHDRWRWVDMLGGLSLATVFLGVLAHSGLRLRVSLKSNWPRGKPTPAQTDQEAVS